MEEQREEVATNTQQGNLPPTDRRPWQYSLRTLFAVTTLVAIVSSLLFASPGWVRYVTGVSILLAFPAGLTVVLIYGCGYVRTFAIGALFPAGTVSATVGAYAAFTLGYLCVMSPGGAGFTLEDLGECSPGIPIAVYCTLSVVVGFFAVSIRWLIESPQRRRQPPEID